jgi:tetratricopeptide (TPR) repeat protein
LLESTRAFALEKLEQSREGDALARRHAQWAADLGDRAYEASWTKPEPTSQWIPEVAPEFENARSAIHWALSHDEVILAARIASGFSRPYRYLGEEAEMRSWLDAVLAKLDADAQAALAARAWCALSSVTLGSRRIDAAQRAVQLGERCNDAAITTIALSQLAYGLRLAGRVEEAQAPNERALRLSKQSGLTRSIVHVSTLNVAGIVANELGRLDDARQLYAEALALATALGDEFYQTTMHLNVAELEFKIGNTARALELASAIKGSTGFNARTKLINSAAYQIALDDIAAARTSALEALRLARGEAWLDAAIAIQHLATVAALRGDARRGARLRSWVDASFRSEGYEREPTEARLYEILMTALREKLSDAEVEALSAEGAQMTEDQAVAEALAV